mgnify:CR=1 FL=1
MRIFQGSTDLDISPIGEKQLEYLKKRFENIHIDKIYSSPLIQRVILYLKENLGGEISLSRTAEKFGVSDEHLSRTFKKQTGFCFSEYLTLYRLQKAEYMLKNEPGRSINGVAFSCGFNDSNYFSYKFKKAYGKSPKKISKKS